MTDTINAYPTNNISRFVLGFNRAHFGPNLWSVNVTWLQKLDLDTNHDGGIVEYSIDTGKTWMNLFNNPNVQSITGFNVARNKDTLVTGEYAFSGTDSSWRQVKMEISGTLFIGRVDSFMLRYTLLSDSIDNNREGWMIDNLEVFPVNFDWVNTLNEDKKLLVYPTWSGGVINIKGDSGKVIDRIAVINAEGKVVRRFSPDEEITVIDIIDMPDGLYFLHIQTDDGSEVHRITLKH